MKIQGVEGAVLDESFKKVANYLLHSDVRKHNQYCPCCKNYEEGNALTLVQMSEYLEYIRQLHFKLSSGPVKPYKKDKPRDRNLEFDSVSELTDLDEEGILTSSMN